jgi:hypothetical protein
MIPNFALDSTVNRHLQALAASGQDEWQPGGQKINEWNIRREYVISLLHHSTVLTILHGRKWKQDSASRAAGTARRSNHKLRRHTYESGNVVNIDDEDDLAAWLVPEENVDDESYSEVVELFPPPVHLRPRSNRTRGR